jgi:hypothetical protein
MKTGDTYNKKSAKRAGKSKVADYFKIKNRNTINKTRHSERYVKTNFLKSVLYTF